MRSNGIVVLTGFPTRPGAQAASACAAAAAAAALSTILLVNMTGALIFATRRHGQPRRPTRVATQTTGRERLGAMGGDRSMPLTRSRVAAALLLGLVALLAPTSARAQSQAVRDYVLLARDSITISQSQIDAGDVGVLDGALTSPRSLTAPLSTLAAPTVRLGDEAVCRGIHATSTRGGGPGCREAGAFAQPFSTTTGACAFPDPFPECDPFATRVIVPRGATLALPPGAYSDILVEGGGGGSGVLLLSGSYTLCSLRLSRDATVNFTGPTTLYVDGSLTSGNDTAFVPRAGVPVDQVQVFVAGRLVRFNRKASVGALVCAPDATVRITNGVTLRGQVVGDSMRIRRSTLTLETGGATTTTTTTIANASTTTTTLPPPGRCGDGTVDPGEVCDGDVTCTSPGAPSSIAAPVDRSRPAPAPPTVGPLRQRRQRPRRGVRRRQRGRL